MQPKLIRTDVAEYVPATWDGENRSGIRPLGEMVLILTDQVKDKTAGGVFLTEDNRNRQEMAAETGVLVAVGDGAFLWTHDKARAWEGEIPHIGDRVYIQRYAGQVFPGRDGQRYRMMEYTCIGGIAEVQTEAANV